MNATEMSIYTWELFDIFEAIIDVDFCGLKLEGCPVRGYVESAFENNF